MRFPPSVPTIGLGSGRYSHHRSFPCMFSLNRAVVVAKQVSIFFALLPTLPILCQHKQLLDEPLYSRRLTFPNCQKSRNARVTMLRPLRLGDYGIVFTEYGLRVAHGERTFWLMGESQSNCIQQSFLFIPKLVARTQSMDRSLKRRISAQYQTLLSSFSNSRMAAYSVIRRKRHLACKHGSLP